MSVSPAGAETFPELVLIPCHAHGRIVLVPPDHPLLRVRKLTLAQIARFPIISYSKEFPAHTQIVRAFEDAGQAPNIVLTASDIDGVILATPDHQHAKQLMAGVRAGKDVFCEKPMATTRDDAKAMMAAAKKTGKFLMIGLNQRLMPAHRRAKEIILAGQPFTAAEGYDWGIVNKVCPLETLMDAALATAFARSVFPVPGGP